MNDAAPTLEPRASAAAEDARWGVTVVVATAAATALRALYAGAIELAPQEAYYWQYARHLDLSYYDHPPLSAWLIAASVRLLGSTELGVRLPAVLSGAALTLLLYRLGARLWSPRAGALAALFANATVLFGLGAVIITPDVPLVLCWTAALLLLCEVVLPDGAGAGRGAWRWYALGALCGLALLSKYTAGLLPVQILATALLLPRGRAALRTPHPYLAALVALAVFSPVLVWNARNGWASFAFQTAARAADSDGFRLDLLGRYLALQVVAVGPLAYVALLVALGSLARRWGEARAKLLLVASAPGIAIFTVLSPWTFVKMNWVAPCYVALLVGLAGLLDAAWPRRSSRRWAAAIAGSGAALALAAHAVPLTDRVPFPSRDALMNGWRELAAAVDAAREARPDRDPLVVGWGYKVASELAFYLRGQPEVQSSPALGVSGLAYDDWLAQAGDHRDALVVVSDRYRVTGGVDVEAALARRCASSAPLAPVPVHRGATVITTYRLYWCEGLRDPRRLPLTAR